MSKNKLKELANAAKFTTTTIPYEFNGLICDVSVTNDLTLAKSQLFCESVWSICFAPDSAGQHDYRPYLYDTAVDFMTLALFTDLGIDMEKDFNLLFDFIAVSDLADLVGEMLGSSYLSLIKSAYAYVECQLREQTALQQAWALSVNKSQLDELVIGILERVAAILDEQSQKPQVDLQAVLDGVKDIKAASEQNKLVGGVLDFIAKRDKAGVPDGDVRATDQ